MILLIETSHRICSVAVCDLEGICVWEKQDNRLLKHAEALPILVKEAVDSFTDIKAIAIRKLETLQNLDSNSNEYHKIKGWVDGLLKIPFNIYKNEPIFEVMKNNIYIFNKFVYKHKKTFNSCKCMNKRS